MAHPLFLCFVCCIHSAVYVNGLRRSKELEFDEVLRWEHYDKALDNDLYTMVDCVEACMKVIVAGPRILFGPGVELENVTGTVGGLPKPKVLPLGHFRPSCHAPSRTSCRTKLYDVARAAMKTLHGTTFLMAGDSTVRHNYLTFACMMQLVEDPSLMASDSGTDNRIFESVNRSMHAAHGTVCPRQNTTWCMSFPKHNVAIAYQWLQQRSMDTRLTLPSEGGWHGERFPRMLESNHLRMAQATRDLDLGEHDILLLNLGIGYNDIFRGISRLDNKPEFSKASERFDQEVRALMADIMQPTIYRNGKLPQLIWRETVPQHFNTPQRIGDYNASGSCLPVSHKDIENGANVCNEIGNVVMTQLKIPTIRIWKSLSHSERMHTLGCRSAATDFTHYNLDANMWISGQVARALTH